MLTTQQAEAIAAEEALICALHRMVAETERRINGLTYVERDPWTRQMRPHCTDPVRHRALQERVREAKEQIRRHVENVERMEAEQHMACVGFCG